MVERIESYGISNIHKVIVVKRMCEAWFLADTDTMKRILKLGQNAAFNSNRAPDVNGKIK